MLVIDAIFINGGGGKVLLDYLLQEVLKVTSNFTILIDKRIEDEYDFLNNKDCNVIFLQGLNQRNKFFTENRDAILKVLSFGNIPPNVKMNGVVYTYFHQPLYLSVPNGFSFLDKVKFYLKVQILKSYRKNTDFWIIQNEMIKQKLSTKFGIQKNNILTIPFYPPLESYSGGVRNKNSFIYVSNATPHKNHKNLIDAFCKFYDTYNKGTLTLTISEDYPEILSYCNEKISRGYPIKNLGFVKRNSLSQHYIESEFLIFPSLAESFGLGIVEAIDCGCKIIGSDLPYLHEVCVPSLVFDPQNVDSIYQAFCKTVTLDTLPTTTKKIGNKLEELIGLLVH